MKETKPPFKRYVLFCTHCRDEDDCCGDSGNVLRDSLKKTIKERGFARFIRVSKTGCLGICAEGPHALLMPDNVLYKDVQPEDLDTILNRAIEGLSV